MSATSTWARAFGTGLSSLRDRAAARLAALRFNPSRKRLARIASVRLESMDDDPRHLIVTVIYLGGEEREAINTYFADRPVYYRTGVNPPFERP